MCRKILLFGFLILAGGAFASAPLQLQYSNGQDNWIGWDGTAGIVFKTSMPVGLNELTNSMPDEIPAPIADVGNIATDDTCRVVLVGTNYVQASLVGSNNHVVATIEGTNTVQVSNYLGYTNIDHLASYESRSISNYIAGATNMVRQQSSDWAYWSSNTMAVNESIFLGPGGADGINALKPGNGTVATSGGGNPFLSPSMSTLGGLSLNVETQFPGFSSISAFVRKITLVFFGSFVFWELWKMHEKYSTEMQHVNTPSAPGVSAAGFSVPAAENQTAAALITVIITVALVAFAVKMSGVLRITELVGKLFDALTVSGLASGVVYFTGLFLDWDKIIALLASYVAIRFGYNTLFIGVSTAIRHTTV